MKFKFTLGDKVRDTFTGLVGFVHGNCEYITGCNQHLVSTREIKDGKPQDGSWLDDVRLEVVEAAPVENAAGDRGGPSAGDASGLRNI